MNTKKLYPFYILLFSLLLTSCKNADGTSIFSPKRVSPPTIEARETTSNADNIGRSSWQKPELVVDILGDIEGEKIADIGAGTGYFVYRLAYKNAKVLAIDIDEDMIAFIEAFKENLPKQVQNNIETRLALPNDPKLTTQEVDKAIIINTISYISDKKQYLQRLRNGIKSGGMVMILDYKNRIIDIPAPSMEDRVSIGALQTALTTAGYINIEVDDTSLDYQYIIKATAP